MKSSRWPKTKKWGSSVSGSPGLAAKAMSFPGSAASRMVTYSTCAVMVVQD
ncbi:MAG: hypothetical protein ACLQED_06800 [Desulfobaccales bacterium]